MPEFTDYVTCPQCGFEDHEATSQVCLDEQEAECICSECGTKYKVTCTMVLEYSSEIISKKA